ncbi:LytR family transcriptional regulator [Geobacillus genomosp. 3]|uniref:LytR family transcriptional regulator n=2 Tax=Geobacillus TaxID=129337 RepID=S5ZFU8_GEOG3|nr:LytR family transcriptional regulator [Geobacillus genomosp. 3]
MLSDGGLSGPTWPDGAPNSFFTGCPRQRNETICHLTNAAVRLKIKVWNGLQEVGDMDSLLVSAIRQVVNEWFPVEASLVISDDRRYIYYQPSRQIDLKIRPGDEIKPDSVTYKALVIRRKIEEQKDSRVFGVPYFGVSVPILEDGVPKGCVTAVWPKKPLLATSYLTIRTMDRWVPVPFDAVVYLEAQNRKTFVKSMHVGGHHKYNLTELEFSLPADRFIRCHRSYIVNVEYIAEIQPDSHSTFLLVMKDGSKVPVSQTYASHFRRRLGF